MAHVELIVSILRKVNAQPANHGMACPVNEIFAKSNNPDPKTCAYSFTYNERG